MEDAVTDSSTFKSLAVAGLRKEIADREEELRLREQMLALHQARLRGLRAMLANMEGDSGTRQRSKI